MFQQQTSLITPHTQRPETQEHATRSLQNTCTMRMRQSLHRVNIGRSFNTRIKEHKACQRLGDGDKSAIVKHAQQQHKINWEDSSLITSIPHWHTRRVRKPLRSYNTTQFHKIAGYTSTTSGTLSCRRHKHCFTQVRNQLNIKSLHSRLQPTHKSSTLQSSSHSPGDSQHRLTETSRPSQPQQFFSELPHGATASFTSSYSISIDLFYSCFYHL